MFIGQPNGYVYGLTRHWLTMMQGLNLGRGSPMTYNEEMALTTHNGQAGIDHVNTHGWEEQTM